MTLIQTPHINWQEGYDFDGISKEEWLCVRGKQISFQRFFSEQGMKWHFAVYLGKLTKEGI